MQSQDATHVRDFLSDIEEDEMMQSQGDHLCGLQREYLNVKPKSVTRLGNYDILDIIDQ